MSEIDTICSKFRQGPTGLEMITRRAIHLARPFAKGLNFERKRQETNLMGSKFARACA